MKKISLTVIILLFLLTPTIFGANIPLNIEYPSFGGVTPSSGMNISDLAVWFYYAIITIATAAAFGTIIWGGIEYLTSAGDPGKTTSGKERIRDAIVGLLIILISYLILQTINPQLLEMPQLKI